MEDRLAVLVHELRSPVAALAAIAEAVADRRTRLDAAQSRRLLELAVEACRSIDRLVADEDVVSVEPRRLLLAPLLDGIARGRAELQVEAGLVVYADPVRLRQAVGNLLDNAERHGASVRITAGTAGDEVVIAVSDDGPGVPEELDVFAAGVSGTGSTGYGLAVSRAIAERHGGRLELDRSQAPGATFRLVLPSGGG